MDLRRISKVPSLPVVLDTCFDTTTTKPRTSLPAALEAAFSLEHPMTNIMARLNRKPQSGARLPKCCC
jgi:hypothetical protein